MFFKPKAAPHRLRQSSTDASFMAADGSIDIAQMANMISMMIWGLVLTKARAGLEAVESKDTSKVSGLLSRAVSLIALIAAAAIFKLVATMSQAPTGAPVVHTPKLQQSHQQNYPESYYDESSPHYMGGAHNVALQNLKSGNIPQGWERRMEIVGGNQNVALEQLRSESNRRVAL